MGMYNKILKNIYCFIYKVTFSTPRFEISVTLLSLLKEFHFIDFEANKTTKPQTS